MLRLIFLSIFLLGSSHALAATHCACEKGKNQNEKFFFKTGCDLWLRTKKCDTKKVVYRKPTQKLSQFLPTPKAGDIYELSYVGGWNNFSQTIRYVDSQVVPLAQKKGVDVRFDNTGSRPMADPEAVQEYLMNLSIPSGSQILIKGSQVDSLGMWDELFYRKYNFYAYASTQWTNPKFLPCEKIENKVCSAAYQADQRGRCYDGNIKRLVWLYCQKPGGTKHAYEWQRR